MSLLTDQILATGVTLDDLIHIVITGDTSQNPAGSSYKAKVEQVAVAIGTAAFSGGTVIYPTTFTNGLSANTFYATTYLNLPGSSSGNCLSDLYVGTIHSCSPLYVNPLDEGNIYFGSNPTLSVDVANNRVGIGTTFPQQLLDVNGKTKTINFQMTSGSFQDYVLVDSDGGGNGQWRKTNQLQAKNWGSFLSTVDQSITVAGTTYKMSADTGSSSGVTLSANTRFVVSTSGVYNIQFSAQLVKNSPATSVVFIWLSKNGSPVVLSNGEIALAGNSGERQIATWNWVDEATTSNTYYEIEWTATVNNVTMDYIASPTYGPAIPSLIVTVTQV